MSFLPPGYVRLDELARHYQVQLDMTGIVVAHTPAGSVTTTSVVVTREDALDLTGGGSALILHGYIPGSGFAQVPAKNDVFVVASVNYKAFDVQGPDGTGALQIHLTR